MRSSPEITLTACLLLTLLAGAPARSTPEPSIDERVATQKFIQAAMSGDIETVRARLDAGLPIDTTLPPRDPRYPYTVRTALEAAAVYARMDLVRLLLERGAKLRRDERYGIYAASLHTVESPELLELLVAHAGRESDLDADFGPALVRAAANGADREVAYLLSIGVDPNWRGRSEPWDDPAIVRAGTHFDVIELLLAAGADPTGGELPDRWSLLFPAARASNAAMTRRFLALGIDPHLRGDRGNALSIAACSTPRTARPTRKAMTRTNEVVSLLLEREVDPNVSSGGRTPLRCAEDAHNTELAAILAEVGGRSHESLWVRLKRGVRSAGLALALLFGGGM